MHFSFGSGTLQTLGFLLTYLAAPLLSHLSFFCVFKSQSSSRSSPRVLLTSLVYSSPRQLCPWFQLPSMWPSHIYISSLDLCSELQTHMSNCLLHVLQIPVHQHVQNWNHLFQSFDYLFHVSKPPWSLSQEMANCPLVAKVWTLSMNPFLYQINQKGILILFLKYLSNQQITSSLREETNSLLLIAVNLVHHMVPSREWMFNKYLWIKWINKWFNLFTSCYFFYCSSSTSYPYFSAGLPNSEGCWEG